MISHVNPYKCGSGENHPNKCDGEMEDDGMTGLAEARKHALEILLNAEKERLPKPEAESYDSRPDTYSHRDVVRSLMLAIIKKLMDRAEHHDDSKLLSPEVEVFDEYTQRLKSLTYGSDEYKACLEKMKPALDHHYQNNRHHPEHYPDGVKSMTLLDLIEMICDWKAATIRHADGDILKSVEINQKRFGYSDEVKQILLNTLKEMGG